MRVWYFGRDEQLVIRMVINVLFSKVNQNASILMEDLSLQNGIQQLGQLLADILYQHWMPILERALHFNLQLLIRLLHYLELLLLEKILYPFLRL